MKGLKILCLAMFVVLVAGISVAQDRDVRVEMEEKDGTIVMLDSSTDVDIDYNQDDPQPFNIRIFCDGADCPYGPRDSDFINNPLSFSMCGTTEEAWQYITDNDFYTDELRIPRSGTFGASEVNCAPGVKQGEIVDGDGNNVKDVPSLFYIDYRTSGGRLHMAKQTGAIEDDLKVWRLEDGSGKIEIRQASPCSYSCIDVKDAKTNTILTPYNDAETGHVDTLNEMLENPYGDCGTFGAECNLAKSELGAGWSSSCNGRCPLGHVNDGERPDYALRGEIILSDSGTFHICDTGMSLIKEMDGRIVTSSGDNFEEDTFECENSQWEPVPPPSPPPKYGGCTDGSDTDGDGVADSADPGCVQPYGLDGDEADYRDTDMTATFGGTPSSDSPSITKGGLTYINANLIFMDGGGSYSVTERYNQKGEWSKSPTGSEAESSTVSRSPGVARSAGDYDTLTPLFQQARIVIDSPYSSFTASAYLCGNGERNIGEDNFNCPKDFGLPDDVGNTFVQSPDTITDQVGTVSNDGYEGGSDDFSYAANLQAEEASGTRTDDVTGSATDHTYEAAGTNGELPDPYMNSDPAKTVWKKSVKQQGTTNFGTVTDYDLTDEEDNDWPDSASSYFPTSCSAPGENATCDTEDTYCTSVSQNTVKDYDLGVDTKTVRGNTKLYETTASKPGIEESTTDLGLAVDVTYNPKPTDYDELDADNCDNFQSEKDCDYNGGPGGRDCSVSDYEWGYGKKGSDTTVEYKGYESTDYNYYYENLKYTDKKFFSTDPSESTIPTSTNLWGGDVNALSFINKNHYWSVAKDDDSYTFDNDEAVASSEMKVTNNGGDQYWSTRTWYGVFDADGPDGTGDSYVTVGHEQENEPFNAETGIVSGLGGTPEQTYGTPLDFVTAKNVGCGEWFCVSAQDVYMQNLDQWGNPTNPATGYEIDTDTKGVSEDYSVCRTFQELIGGVDESYLRCQYDDSRSFPEGPTPSYQLDIVS